LISKRIGLRGEHGLSSQKKLSAKIFHLFTLEELKQIRISLGFSDGVEVGSRGFTISKTQSETKVDNFCANTNVMSITIKKIDELAALVEELIEGIENQDLIKIFEEITSKKLNVDNLKKSEISRRLFDEVPLDQILQNKRFQERFKPRYVTTSDIKSINENLNSVASEIANFHNKIEFLKNEVKIIHGSVSEINNKVRPIEDTFKIDKTQFAEKFLQVMYDFSTHITEKPDPAIFYSIVDKLRKEIGVDEQTFLIKGSELFLAYYFFSQIKRLDWKPNLDTFVKVINEEMKRIKPNGERIAIPLLRDCISRQIAIDEISFDKLLLEAWKTGKLKLEVGAPIGEFNVKYLVDDEGQRFYYVLQK
jgi:hypothetical protein